MTDDGFSSRIAVIPFVPYLGKDSGWGTLSGIGVWFSSVQSRYSHTQPFPFYLLFGLPYLMLQMDTTIELCKAAGTDDHRLASLRSNHDAGGKRSTITNPSHLVNHWYLGITRQQEIVVKRLMQLNKALCVGLLYRMCFLQLTWTWNSFDTVFHAALKA